MRKGRSSRRSRVSRPNIGPKTLQNVEASGAPTSTPNVVIGVLADVADHEPVSAERLKIVEPQVGAEPERGAEGAEAARAVEEAIDNLESPAEDAVTVEPPGVEAKVEAEPEAALREAVTPPAPAIASDEESIPPVGDLAVHDSFFSQGDLSTLTDDDALDEPDIDKAARKSAPEVAARRARFVRYVTWAVGVSAVVCLAAVARTTFAPSSNTLAAPAHAAIVVADPPSGPVEKTSPPAEVVAAPLAPLATEEAKPASAEPQAEPAKADLAVPAGDAKADVKDEKATARRALEQRKLTEAIEAGERAVAIDETDAEAWLLLGAAYQEKGRLADARRAYTACVKQGKKGPRHECAQMLR